MNLSGRQRRLAHLRGAERRQHKLVEVLYGNQTSSSLSSISVWCRGTVPSTCGCNGTATYNPASTSTTSTDVVGGFTNPWSGNTQN